MKALVPLTLVALLLPGCSSKKQELPANAYRNETHAFGLVPPAGWKQVTPDAADGFLRSYGARLLPATQEALRNPVQGKTTFVVAWVNIDATEPLFPVIAVSHNSVGLVSVGDHEVRTSANVVRRKLEQSGYTGIQLGAGEIVLVDGYQCIRMTYRATADRFQLRSEEDMVTSQSRTHFVSLHADQQNWDANAAVYAQVLGSFRRFVGR